MSQPEPSTDHSADFDVLVPPLLDLKGDIAEFGVYEGLNTRALCKYGRRVWAFDTYSGIPASRFRKEWDFPNPPGKWVPRYNPDILFYGNPLVTPVVGEFQNTLPQTDASIVFAYVDCDLYESYQCALEWLASGHMVRGGVALCDDIWDCPGALLATKEFIDRHPQLKIEWPRQIIRGW